MQSNVFAQGVTTAAMNGIVVDSNGDPLPGANLLAVHTPSGTEYGTTTRVDGKYNLNALRTGGPYKVTVSFVGYKSQVFEGQMLQLGQNVKLDYTLYEEAVELGDVTVVGEKNSILSGNRTGAEQNVVARDIELVPTVSRSFQEFAKLSPQVSGNSSSVASRNNRYNNIQIDGTQYNDLFGLGSTGTPGGQTGANPISLDAIDQFQVVVAPYDIRYGGFTGGGINAITRSGTNKFKGSVFGFGRNESLVGKAGFDEDNPDYPEFKEYQYGFRLGGPIVKDNLFFFINGESTIKDQPLSNISLSGDNSAAVRSLGDDFARILTSKGMDVGTADEFVTEQPSDKLFVRLDLNQSESHKITLRHNYVGAYQDILGGRSANNQLVFSSLTYRIRNITNSTVLQINSTNNKNLSNEFILGFTSIRDRRAGISANSPEVRVFESTQLVAGPDRFSSANELDQDILELTDNFSIFSGDHIITIGTHNEFFSFRNLFIRSFYGYYEFQTLEDLEDDNPSFYQRVYSIVPGVDKPAADFSVNQLGFYLQDEWSIAPTFKLTLGVRADIPFLPTTPANNDSVSKYFEGYSTTDVPSGNLMFSPRLGFNWDLLGNRSTQVRGGVGVFTGRIPYVWMSNNYGNTGTLIAEVRGSGTDLGFSTDPNDQPGVGDPGTGSPLSQAEINLVDPEFKWPQVLRANLGVDQELPWGMIGTMEYIYTQSINDLIYQKINLRPSTSNVADGRPRFGGTNSGNGNFFDVLSLTNTSEGYGHTFSVQLQKISPRGLGFNVGYTYGESYDQNSVLSSQARSQMRYNPISGDPNSPELATSSFDLGHRVFASVTYTQEFFKNAPTSFSIFYNYQSGRPFSFTYSGDVNNDGFDGNDLMYIPSNRDDIQLGTISGGNYVAASDADYEALFAFIENNEYLSGNKGSIAERNASRAPFNDVLDLRIAQIIPLGFSELQLSLDILNFLNLLNSEWGWYETTSQDTYTALRYRGIANDKPVYSLNTGGAEEPWSPLDLSSRWQMQFGVRLSF
jgi:hypothetical protein